MPDASKRSAADFTDQLKMCDRGFRTMRMLKRIDTSFVHIDQAELAAAAGAVDTLEVRVIDQLDTVLTVGTADLHGNGSPRDVTSSFCHAGQGDASEGAGARGPDPGFMAENGRTWGGVLLIDRGLTF